MLDFAPLAEEFSIWRDLGLVLPLWWRDDDAIAPTQELDRLTDLSARLDIDVHLAVIPDHVQPALGSFAMQHSNLRVITHGWTHRDLSLPRQKSCEFPLHRDPHEVSFEISKGAKIIQELFQASACPIFAPPWNRFSLKHTAALVAAGYTMLSTYKPRLYEMAAPQLTFVNAHIDPIEWRGSRALCPPDLLVARTVKLMQDRRMGYTDPHEPLGYLTHHLDHTEDIWHFTEDFLGYLREGPIALSTFNTFQPLKETQA